MRIANVVLASLVVLGAAHGEKVTLQNSTVVAVETQSQLSSANLSLGQQVLFSVAADVVDKRTGKTVIASGTVATGTVQEAKKAQMAGGAGKLIVSVQSTTTVDGSNVQLSGQFMSGGDSEVGATVAVAVILCPLALLNKGDEGVIPVGAQTRAMTIGQYEVEVD
jgi:hypothetical protein|tara:strand:+ start:1426 stop:1920 length:495 start_codon:yes stop_codon:yes gene_type:complete